MRKTGISINSKQNTKNTQFSGSFADVTNQFNRGNQTINQGAKYIHLMCHVMLENIVISKEEIPGWT
jgi:hypothetical protein